MTLKSLEGQHIFTGVDLYLQDPACVVFELDGTVYEAVENPSDGYRSYMEELNYSCAQIRNKIPPTPVICKHVSSSEEYVDMTHDLLMFIDPENGKTFLTEVMMNDKDAYYAEKLLDSLSDLIKEYDDSEEEYDEW